MLNIAEIPKPIGRGWVRVGLLAGAVIGLGACASTSAADADAARITQYTAQCSVAGLCSVQLTPAQQRFAASENWQSVTSDDGSAAWVQWVDRDGDTAMDTAYFLNTGGSATGQFSTVAAARPDPEVQFVLSQRVGASWEDGRLSGGKFADVTSMDVPKWHKQGTRWLRYEGPAWETREVGYRLYLDSRNGTDIFGKQAAELALHKHGLDGDDYHALKPWGADILKVGDSLGIGAPGLLIDGTAQRINARDSISARITETGPLFAGMAVQSAGWQVGEGAPVTVETHYAIEAGSRLTRVTAQANRALGGWVTGVVKHPGTQLIISGDDQEWQYLASFGQQSVFDDALGMAVFYRRRDGAPGSVDPHSYVVAFEGERRKIDYFMGAWWQADPSGVSNINQFREILERERAQLAALAASAS